jgi:hypothetical protein
MLAIFSLVETCSTLTYCWDHAECDPVTTSNQTGAWSQHGAMTAHWGTESNSIIVSQKVKGTKNHHPVIVISGSCTGWIFQDPDDEQQHIIMFRDRALHVSRVLCTWGNTLDTLSIAQEKICLLLSCVVFNDSQMLASRAACSIGKGNYVGQSKGFLIVKWGWLNQPFLKNGQLNLIGEKCSARFLL